MRLITKDHMHNFISLPPFGIPRISIDGDVKKIWTFRDTRAFVGHTYVARDIQGTFKNVH